MTYRSSVKPPHYEPTHGASPGPKSRAYSPHLTRRPESVICAEIHQHEINENCSPSPAKSIYAANQYMFKYILGLLIYIFLIFFNCQHTIFKASILLLSLLLYFATRYRCSQENKNERKVLKVQWAFIFSKKKVLRSKIT